MDLGTIQYNVEANTTDLDRATDAIDQMAQEATGAATEVDGLGKTISKTASQSASATKSMKSDYASLAADLRRQADLFGETSHAAKLRYDIEQGALSDLSSAQRSHLISLAQNVDAVRDAATGAERLAAEQRSLAEQARIASAALNQQYETIEQSLRREIALFGETGRAARLAYEMQNGALKGLSETQKQSINAMAKHLDALDAGGIAASGFSQKTNAAGKSVKNFNGIMGQFGYQMQDAIVQLQMGANAGMVFAQQGSQLFSVFNPMLGLLAAVGGVMAGMLIPSMLSAGESADQLTERIAKLRAGFDQLTAAQQASVLAAEQLAAREKTKEISDQEAVVRKLRREIENLEKAHGRTITITGEYGAVYEELIDNSGKLQSANEELIRQNLTLSQLQNDLAGISGDNKAAEEAEKQAKVIGDLINSLESQLAQLTLSDEAMGDYIASQAKATGADKERIKSLYQQIQAEKDSAEAKKESERITEQLAKKEESRANAIARLNDQMAKEAALMGITSREAEILYDIKNGLLDVTNDEAAALIKNAKALDAARKSQEEYNDVLADLEQFGWEEAFETLPTEAQKFGEEAARRLGDAVTGTLVDIQNGASDLFDGIERLWQQLLAEMAYQAAIKPIALNIQQQMSGGGGSLLAGVGMGGAVAVGAIALTAAISSWNKKQDEATRKLSAEYRQGFQSTGTLLGDGNKKSDSINQALENLGNINIETLNVNRAMLDALRDLKQGIGAVAGMAARGGGINVGGLGSGGGSGALGATALGATAGLYGAAAGAAGLAGIGAATGGVGLLVYGLANVIGGDVGGFVNGIVEGVGKAIYSKKKKVIDSGIKFSSQALSDIMEDGLVDVFNYAVVNTKKKTLGVTTSSKNKEVLESIGGDIANQFGLVFQAGGRALDEASKAFGIDFQQYVDRLTVSTEKLSLKDLEGDALVQEIESFFSATLDNWAGVLVGGTGTLEKFQRVGEGAFETVIRLATEVNVFNKYAELLNLNMKATGVAAIVASQNIAEAAGGFDALAASMNTYYSKFFSEEERARDQLEMLSETLRQAGAGSIPTTREQFRALIEAQDLTTASGQKLFAELIGLSGAADAYISALEKEKKAKDELYQSSVDSAFNALQRSADAQRKIIGTQIDLINDSLSTSRAVYSALESSLNGLVITSNRTLAASRAQARAQLGGFLAGARGGVLPDINALNDALSVISQPSENLYSTFEEYAFDFAQTAATIKELQDITGDQITTEEKALAELESQNKYLDEMVGYAKNQIDLMRGIDNSVISMSAAMYNLASMLGIQFPTMQQLAVANDGVIRNEQGEALRVKMEEINARQTAQAKQHNDFMQASQIAVAENTLQIRKILEKCDVIGMPPVREDA